MRLKQTERGIPPVSGALSARECCNTLMPVIADGLSQGLTSREMMGRVEWACSVSNLEDGPQLLAMAHGESGNDRAAFLEMCDQYKRLSTAVGGETFSGEVLKFVELLRHQAGPNLTATQAVGHIEQLCSMADPYNQKPDVERLGTFYLLLRGPERAGAARIETSLDLLKGIHQHNPLVVRSPEAYWLAQDRLDRGQRAGMRGGSRPGVEL